LLDALLASEPAATFDTGFLRVREQLASFHGLQPADPAPAFQGTLRDYQREGLGWLHFLRRFGFGGCLADDMGLGKSLTMLSTMVATKDSAQEYIACRTRGALLVGSGTPCFLTRAKATLIIFPSARVSFPRSIRSIEQGGSLTFL